MTIVGGIELGGTKIRVARGSQAGEILDSVTFPTTDPAENFARIRAFLETGSPVAAIGIGSFGPVTLARDSPDYGAMRSTPKPGWSGFNVIQALAPMRVPIALETDVAAAGLGEHRRGALRDVSCGIYLTVGTGIGGAMILNGRIVNGAAHAEMGHVALRRAPTDTSPSTCPYHTDCAEGLASGPAISGRFGRGLSAAETGADERALIADYLGQLLANLVLVLSPQRIVVGGGVAKTPGLLALAHGRMLAHLNGYAGYPAIHDPDFVIAPALGDDAGLSGALLLAGPRTTE